MSACWFPLKSVQSPWGWGRKGGGIQLRPETVQANLLAPDFDDGDDELAYDVVQAERDRRHDFNWRISQLDILSNWGGGGGGEGKTASSVRAVVKFTTAMNGVAIMRTPRHKGQKRIWLPFSCWGRGQELSVYQFLTRYLEERNILPQ